MEVKSIITHPSPGLAIEGCGLLRDLRPRLVRARHDPPGRSVGRRRQELGAGGAAGAGAAEGAHALSRCLAVERRSRRPAEPRHRRDRHGAADARAIRRASAACAASTTTTPSPAGASTRRGRRAMRWLERVRILRGADVARRICAAARVRGRCAAIRPADRSPADLAPGTSASARTARACRRAAARRRRAKRSIVAKCQACHGEKGAGQPERSCWSAASGRSPATSRR